MTVKKTFPEISAESWEHPADKAALAFFRGLPGAEALAKGYIGSTTERSLRLLALASSARATSTQFASVHATLKEACGILDVKEIPEVFVSQNPVLNAGAVGVEHPFILLNSSLLEIMDRKELAFVIGHELGHCMSGHVAYKTLLWLALRAGAGILQAVPMGEPIIKGLVAALLEWNRKSELSADRAGLLVAQEFPVGCSSLMKTAGGARVAEMNLDDFYKQAEEYDRGKDILDSVQKILGLLDEDHPLPILRIIELGNWEKSGSYCSILEGKYVKRGERPSDNFAKSIDDAARQYKEDLQRSGDPLAQAAGKLAEGMESAKKRAEDLLGGLFRQ
jgi:Zn-dependent protease with chaperone function